MKNFLRKFLFIIFFLFLIVYLLGTVYFENRYQFNTFINNENVSKKTENQVIKELFESEIPYINIKGKEIKDETIMGDEIEYKTIISDNFYEILKSQNKFFWPLSLINIKEFKVSSNLEFNENLLKERLKETNAIKNKNAYFPQDAYIKRDNSGFRIIPEKTGTVIDFDSFYNGIKKAIYNKETLYDIEKEENYLKPEITKESEELKQEIIRLKKATKFKITYKTYKGSTTLTDKQFAQWININDNGIIDFVDEEKIKNLVDQIASECNTVGNTINFTTQNSGNITLNSKTYGWKVDKTKAIEEITSALYKGEDAIIDIPFSNKGSENDGKIGNTYIEVSLTEQHLWFFKDGELIIESDVVTGLPTKERETNIGLYSIYSREKERYLGTMEVQGYSSFVNYWMPFNGGQGLHDATWRDDSEFGGSTYKTNGSHGCVNLPLDTAKIIYENSHTGYPVIIY